MSDWKESRAEAEMREAGKKIMAEAAKRSVNKMEKVGKWTITLRGNENHTKEEIENIMSKLVDFARECDTDTPNLEISIDPA